MSEKKRRISAKEKALLIEAAAKKHGGLTPEAVVKESDPRNSDGVCHLLAQSVGWHKSEADLAQEKRIDNARALIRSVEPELIMLGIVTIQAPHYVRDPRKPNGEQGYVQLAAIKSKEEVAADTMRAEIDRAVGSLQRAYSVAMYLGLSDDAASVFNALASLGRAPAAVSVEDGIGEQPQA